mgnify:FL=1
MMTGLFIINGSLGLDGETTVGAKHLHIRDVPF